MKNIKCGLAISLIAILGSFNLFAEGLSIDGYLRTGAQFAIDKSDDEDDRTFSTEKYADGRNLGGGSRLRLNLSYEKDEGGIVFRFQKEELFDKDWFSDSNVKWLMGYANLFDNKIIAEAGKLKDRFTSTGGDADFSFGQSLGARVVANPIESLWLTAQASDLHAEENENGDIIENEKLFSFSGKYQNDYFSVVAGYHLAKEFYAGLNLTYVENLSLILESDYNFVSDESKVFNNCLNVTYALGNTKFGGIAYYKWTDNEDIDDVNAYEIYPFVSYKVNDTFTPALELAITGDDQDDTDVNVEVTPSIQITAAPKTTVAVYFTWSKEDDTRCGIGVNKKF